MSQGVDIYVLYKIIKALTTPFDEMDAYEAGIIDRNGKLLKKPRGTKEKKAYTPFDRFVINIKRIFKKLGIDSRMGSFAAALWLIRESYEEGDEEKDIDAILSYLEIIENKEIHTFSDLYEEISNTTGAAVAGTGDDPVHWVKKKKGRPKVNGKYINGVTFLRRTAKKHFERQKNDDT